MFSGVIASFASLNTGAEAEGGTIERTEPEPAFAFVVAAFAAAPFVGECGSSSSSSTFERRIAREPIPTPPVTKGELGAGSTERRDDADALNERRGMSAWRREYPTPWAFAGTGTGSGS